ncbi:hypothetical protein [Escherichia coli]|nr:hypothetical protein [Escherichia coli]EEU9398617.1 hypothetical protein [Escherichia coli]EEV5820389.1 hypothetical protein [Escherichia coli]EFA4342052.1 hypothetical protein [Escherichia coli]EFO1231599.1 hypothetical protein [Escherichia coli]EGL7910745.1 hypothetical protein [Escherichia coli]
MSDVNIGVSGNTSSPCVSIIRLKDYTVTVSIQIMSDDEFDCAYEWYAKRDNQFFRATNPEELLGLIVMWEYKGINWQSEGNEYIEYKNIIENAQVFDKNGKEITSI